MEDAGIATIYQRLRKAQLDLKAPKNKVGRFGKSRSAEDILEAAKPVLDKHKLTLVVSDDIELIGEHHYIKATATIYDDKGDHLSSEAHAWEGEISRGLDAPQVTGAASSYARKYALGGLLAIDDTKDADVKQAEPPKRPTPPAKPATQTELATDTQRAQIRSFARALGVEDEDIPALLRDDYGVNGKLTKTEAARVLKEMQ